MWYEVERKFRIQNFRPIEEALVRIEASVHTPIKQVDVYFAHPSRDFSETDEAFRVRSVGDANWITYKGPKIDTTTKTRQEIELPLPDGDQYVDQFTRLLEALGFQRVAQVSKQRRKSIFQWDTFQVELALDEVEQVGQFVELEIGAEEAMVDAARNCLQSLVERLDLRDEERRSYLELLLENSG